METDYGVVYEACFADLYDNEGKYANIKGDPGGRTWMGVAERFHPQFFKELDECKTDEERIVKVKAFYHENYWNPMNCDAFPPRIAFELFDTAVLCGTTRATEFLQKAINLGIRGKCLVASLLEEDGKFGPLTLKASTTLSKMYPRNVLGWLNYFQGDYLYNLKQTDQIKFGWGRRLSERK